MKAEKSSVLSLETICNYANTGLTYFSLGGQESFSKTNFPQLRFVLYDDFTLPL